MEMENSILRLRTVMLRTGMSRSAVYLAVARRADPEADQDLGVTVGRLAQIGD